MQLRSRGRGRLCRTLGLLTANLFVVTGVQAQQAPSGSNEATPSTELVSDEAPQSDLGMTRIDTSVLFYQEDGGRVRTIEPVALATLNADNGDILTVKLTSDTLTGATPNGATPWTSTQTFTTPAHAPGTQSVVTGSSGGSKLVTIPGVGTIVRQYSTAPNQLPVDAGFRDQREAIDLGYSSQLNADTSLSGGLGGSVERDYTSLTGSLGGARDFNHKNTTLSASFNFEYDLSRPYFGTPTPLTVMSGDPKGPSASKRVYNVVLGVTQVMTRRWLLELNYSYGSTQGYQTDPYLIISVVDPTGAPLEYLYESRPNTRTRESVYMDNRIAVGPTFADLTARYYWDSWGIKSVTVGASDRIPLIGGLYVEPEGRYYDQTAASFFHNYLLSTQPIPTYASSDSRLSKFSAVTAGARIGLKVGSTGELYLEGERYIQTGVNHPAGAPGALAMENLFSGVSATSFVLGYTFAFY